MLEKMGRSDAYAETTSSQSLTNVACCCIQVISLFIIMLFVTLILLTSP